MLFWSENAVLWHPKHPSEGRTFWCNGFRGCFGLLVLALSFGRLNTMSWKILELSRLDLCFCKKNGFSPLNSNFFKIWVQPAKLKCFFRRLFNTKIGFGCFFCHFWVQPAELTFWTSAKISVWALACCEWRAAAPGLRLPRAPKIHFPENQQSWPKHCENWLRESGSEFHKTSLMCERGEWRKQLRDFITQSLKQIPLGSGTISILFWSNWCLHSRPETDLWGGSLVWRTPHQNCKRCRSGR